MRRVRHLDSPLFRHFSVVVVATIDVRSNVTAIAENLDAPYSTCLGGTPRAQVGERDAKSAFLRRRTNPRIRNARADPAPARFGPLKKYLASCGCIFRADRNLLAISADGRDSATLTESNTVCRELAVTVGIPASLMHFLFLRQAKDLIE